MRALERLTNTVAMGTGLGALALALLFGPVAALAGEWELRLPVQKTARMTLPEQPAPATTDSAPATAEKRADASAAPKTALGRAAEAAATAEKAAAKPVRTPEAKPAPAKSAQAQPVAAAHAPGAAKAMVAPDLSAASKAAPATAAIPQAEPKKDGAPKAAAEKAVRASAAPAVDPKALALPQQKPQGTPLPLPPDGKWVGDIVLEFQPDRVIVHAATNTVVERVTWFNLATPDAPRKLAVDLRGPWRKKGSTLLRYDTGPVKAVAVGEHQDRLRLSIEFRNGAVSRELDPDLVKEVGSLRVSIPLAVRLGS